MALYYFYINLISRGKGDCIVDIAAYRAGEMLYCRYNKKEYDYSDKKGIIYKEVLLPLNAPQKYKNRELLWNEVEELEKLKNSQLARQIKISLQVEFDLETQIEILKQYAKENFVDKGMIADITINSENKNNPYAYILLTLREFDINREWKFKSKAEYILDTEGKKIKSNGRYRQRKIYLNDWNDKETLLSWRKNWAEACNNQFKKMKLNIKLDYRTYEHCDKK